MEQGSVALESEKENRNAELSESIKDFTARLESLPKTWPLHFCYAVLCFPREADNN